MLIFQMWVSATDQKVNAKRKKSKWINTKLPLTQKTQFLLTMQEECDLTFYFFLLRQNV